MNFIQFFVFVILIFFVCIFSWNWYAARAAAARAPPPRGEKSPTGPSTKMGACLYAYYEKNDEYKENLSYFLKNAGINCGNIDYYIIINGECTVDLSSVQSRPNVFIIKRQNTGFDFGAWQYCIHNISHSGKTYDYYFFLNSSVRGPFPAEFGTLGGRCPPKWVDLFTELFISPFGVNTNVNLAGVSINVLMERPEIMDKKREPPYTHVQSQFFVLSRKGFEFLMESGFFNDDDILNDPNTNMEYMVVNKEIKMSSLILDNGWNINAYLSEYKNRDYRKIKKNINPTGDNPWRTCGTRKDQNPYFGRNITPEDAIFFKTNLSCVAGV